MDSSTISRQAWRRATLPVLLLLAMGSATMPAHAQGAGCTPKGVEHCPVKIVNRSKTYTADQFHVLSVAQKVDAACQGQVDPAKICPPAYVRFDDQGVGTLVAATAGMTSLPFARRLSDFPLAPGTSDTYVLQMPRHGSGRIYLTLGESLSTTVIGAAPPYGVSDPNLGSSREPNFYRIYDKFESSFLPYTKGDPTSPTYDPHETNPLYINITSVDSLSIPLSLGLTGNPAPAKPGPVGYVKPRSEIVSAVQAGLKDGVTAEWEKLTQALDGTTLRVIAPNKGLKDLSPGGNDPCTLPGADPCFDRDYFQSHIRATWSHYDHGTPANAGNTITVVADEILSKKDRDAGRTLKYTGFVTASECPVESTQPQTDTCGPYDALRRQGVTRVTGALCFRRDPLDATVFDPPQPDYIPVQMPTTDDMISGSGALCPPNATARSIIARDLSAAMNRGLLPLPGAIVIDDGRKDDPQGFWQSQRGNFYTRQAANARPAFNLYAKILHDLSTGGVYAFAFDDVGGADSTLVDVNADAAIVTIQDMTGTPIPNPTARDTGTYTVNIAIPGGSAFPNQSVRFEGKVLAGGANTFTNVGSPLRLVWTVNGVDHPLSIHLRTKFITPPALGDRDYNLVISAPVDPAGAWTIAFPGGSTSPPPPWPSGDAPKLTLDTKSTGRLGYAVLVRDVVGNDYASLPADWYLWVKTAAGATYYYDATRWVLAASGDDGVQPFARGVRLPAASSPNGEVQLPNAILSAGDNVVHFGVNVTRYLPRKDDGTLFQVSTTYPYRP